MKSWEFNHGVLTIGKEIEGGGWFICIAPTEIVLYEVPLYGGQEQEIGRYDSIESALEKANSLT